MLSSELGLIAVTLNVFEKNDFKNLASFTSLACKKTPLGQKNAFIFVLKLKIGQIWK